MEEQKEKKWKNEKGRRNNNQGQSLDIGKVGKVGGKKRRGEEEREREGEGRRRNGR
ncbi:hypothetical protein ASPWEDRAFT_36743 [Aspergillus wentii DTO 134E9]|uniref:Uncharacterized protein n=1 Tax=Aspergillus wentii DTO 134E9 TaxID=1073089 RepID=A0A1L9RVR9_ASPWE|nr:uncharacterized protein ASPWEDRAFT_36743 [Aspergillus wentii DTO 134E9]OJJ39030.1 hypothetical protein ASPWEDRAFT_36743 [Aspergillus wentii DTO 134E9]